MASPAPASLIPSGDHSSEPRPLGRPDKYQWSQWWYFLVLPLTPTIAFTVWIISYWKTNHSKWDFSVTDSYVADSNCKAPLSSPFERRFILDLTYGSYSFATAKLIDIVWDTLIGQLGRIIHSYILYRHVARRLLICLMEYSSVTYDDYISILFTQSSFSTMSFLVGRMFRRNQFAVGLSLVGLAYLLLYTILFPTIWGAASGYISPSQVTYRMPNDTYLPLDSPHLTLCWNISGGRLGLPQSHIEVGPDFSMLRSWLTRPSTNGAWSGWSAPEEISDTPPLQGKQQTQPKKMQDFSFKGWRRTVWDDIGPAAMGLGLPISNDFKHIFSYAFTSRMLQVVYNATGVDSAGYNTEFRSPESEGRVGVALNVEASNVLDVSRKERLSSIVDFFEFKYALGQSLLSQEDAQHLRYFNTWPMLAFPGSYMLNRTVPPGPGVIPFNSTFYYNDTKFALDAPFLDVGSNCSHPDNYLTSLGNCVCYDGQPLTVDWYQDENLVCVDTSVYNWGFSSYLIFVGLICELLWIVLALWIRGYCQWWSKLMKHSRVKHADVLWNVLELSQALKRDLGPGITMTPERSLRVMLQRCANISYAANLDVEGNLVGVHIASVQNTGQGYKEFKADENEQNNS